MITLDGKVYTVKVEDTSEERKTAEKLIIHLEAAMKEVEEKWGVTVVAIVTDPSGECRKARRILGRKYPGSLYSIAIHTRYVYFSIIFKIDTNSAAHDIDQSCCWKVLQV
jgi:hypothetical protein